jgi:hypothetical protein
MFTANEMMDPITQDRVGPPIPAVCLENRQFINAKALREKLEKYSGVERKKTGEWKIESPTLRNPAYLCLLQSLKDSDQRTLSMFLHLTNEQGKVINQNESAQLTSRSIQNKE